MQSRRICYRVSWWAEFLDSNGARGIQLGFMLFAAGRRMLAINSWYLERTPRRTFTAVRSLRRSFGAVRQVRMVSSRLPYVSATPHRANHRGLHRGSLKVPRTFAYNFARADAAQQVQLASLAWSEHRPAVSWQAPFERITALGATAHESSRDAAR